VALERAAGAVANPAASPSESPSIRFRVHGANLDLQPGEFQNRIRSLLHETRHTVTYIGRYRHETLAAHMEEVDWVIVPSIWWENSPLVIQEAFHFGRPVICSDIGGMAEKVAANVNGLHFRAGDPTHLAATIRQAAGDPGLWDRLSQGIPPMYRMEQHAERLLGLYRQLLDERVASRAA
jgi:glycosyltransferase involved in cell wall biosynthesis